MKNTTTYRIVADCCNPCFARKHHYNQPVLKWDVATPIKWVMEERLTLDEAYDVLDRYAFDLGDDVSYEDDDSIAAWKRYLEEEEGIEVSFDWYKGAGWYCNDALVYRHGDQYLCDDVMVYSIEEMN